MNSFSIIKDICYTWGGGENETTTFNDVSFVENVALEETKCRSCFERSLERWGAKVGGKV
jgi:hypothetical protein